MAGMVLLRCREAFGARGVCLDELNREPIIICILLGVRAEQKGKLILKLTVCAPRVV
jgi:hypothetical protein